MEFRVIGTKINFEAFKYCTRLGGLLSWCKLRLNTKIHSAGDKKAESEVADSMDSATMTRYPHFKRWANPDKWDRARGPVCRPLIGQLEPELSSDWLVMAQDPGDKTLWLLGRSDGTTLKVFMVKLAS